MAADSKQLAKNEIAFFFSTNEAVPAGPLLFFISEISRIARTKRHFGPGAMVEIISIETGSKRIKLSINQKIAAAGVAAAVLSAVPALGQFALDIHDRLQQPDNRLAKCTATMMIDHGVATAQIITCDGSLDEITRDMMPAIGTVKTEREARRISRQGKPDSGPDYLTFEGDYLTSGGDRLKFSPDGIGRGISPVRLETDKRIDDGSPMMVDGKPMTVDGQPMTVDNTHVTADSSLVTADQTESGDTARLPLTAHFARSIRGSARVNLIGRFKKIDDFSYSFVPESGPEMVVTGVEIGTEIPTDTRFLARGVRANRSGNDNHFIPVSITRIDI